ncbi:MAG: hypothetical protein NW214_02280 [Pseudanabaenaceae cyanobacterium bins.39]|nr:hypothetical protein [Pseudanabaenaceae cyanobacterium bins.39]
MFIRNKFFVHIRLAIAMGVTVAYLSSLVSIPVAVASTASDSQDNPSSQKKLGTTRRLPSLQTRARPPLQPETFHLGMLETQFFEYAKENNWAAIATVHRDEVTMHRLQPGGEGLYALPDRQLVYARGFTADIYFERDRLVGIRMTPDSRDQLITARELLTLVRAWFPDDMVSVIYQVAPSDPRQSIIETLIGTIPPSFEQDLGKTRLPFCRVIIFPAPVSINTLSTCNINI